jgi:hypothetical protein
VGLEVLQPIMIRKSSGHVFMYQVGRFRVEISHWGGGRGCRMSGGVIMSG